MYYTLKVVVSRFLGQVSPNGPPALMLLIPPFMSSSLSPPTVPLLFSHHSIHTFPTNYWSHPNTYIHIVYHPVPLFPFTILLFRPFIAIYLLPAPSSTIINKLKLLFQDFPPPAWPIPSPCPCMPCLPPFSLFFDQFMNTFTFTSIYFYL